MRSTPQPPGTGASRRWRSIHPPPIRSKESLPPRTVPERTPNELCAVADGNRTRLSRVAAHTGFEDAHSSRNVGIDGNAHRSGNDPIQHRQELGRAQQWRQSRFCASDRAGVRAHPADGAAAEPGSSSLPAMPVATMWTALSLGRPVIVDAEVMQSIGALVCVHLWRPDSSSNLRAQQPKSSFEVVWWVRG
jgi:hypothetical protein